MSLPQKLKIQRSALEHHKLFKKLLIPPFNQLTPPMTQIFWVRDLLPEFLWIDSLVHQCGHGGAYSVFTDFLSALDPLMGDSRDIVDGTVTAFGFVPQDLREDFLRTHAGKIDWAVKKPLSKVISPYPECPMNWLLGETDQEFTESAARDAVVRLLPAKDEYCGQLRVLPITRYFAHGKLKITSNLKDLIEALAQYPKGDKAHVESFARSTYNMIVQQRIQKSAAALDWPKHFWRRGRELAPCRLAS